MALWWYQGSPARAIASRELNRYPICRLPPSSSFKDLLMIRFALAVWRRLLDPRHDRKRRRQQVRELTRARLYALTGAWAPESD
jgi:hypothetical protein